MIDNNDKKNKGKNDVFPFNTCENPNKKGIAQPYSFIINAIGVFVIFYYLFQVKHFYTGLTIFLLGVFQSMHSFSHAFHIGERELQNITHITAILLGISFFYMFYNITKRLPHFSIIVILLTILSSDIYLTIEKYPFIYTFFTQISIFLIILVSYYSYLNQSLRNIIKLLIPLTIVVSLIVLNEKYNCSTMLSNYPDFPFHIFVEITGFFILVIIVRGFYKE